MSFSHSGRTDRNGGHHNRKTGEYHKHGGGFGWTWVLLAIGGGVIFLIYKGNKKD